MKDKIDYIKALISQGKLGMAISQMLLLTQNDADTNNLVLAQSARFKEVDRKENLGMLDFDEALKVRSQINFALLELLNQMEAALQQTRKRVFISYNHNDAAVAQQLKEKLKAAGIEVTIDSEAMGAGEDISEFIKKCIRETETTLSVVSRKSLLSAWVAMESINTFFQESGAVPKKFIPCYIEDDFFSKTFTDEVITETNKKIDELATIKKERTEKGLDTRDINNEYTRLLALKNSIDEIVGRLRNSLCIDIRGDKFDTGLSKIIEKIKE